MWHTTYSLLYNIVFEWRPVFPFTEMLSAGSSDKPQARPFAKKLFCGSLLETIMEFWQALTQNWMQRTHKMTRNWRKRRPKRHRTEWPRFRTCCSCRRAAKSYMLPRRNLGLKTSRWLPWDTSVTPKRLSEHCGHSFNMMVWLHLNCREDLLCHHLCLQRTSLEAKLKY